MKVLSLLIQSLDDLAKDGLDIAHTKDGGDDAPLVVVVDQRLGLGVIGVQSLLDCGFGVICPLLEVCAACIALSFDLGLIELHMVGRPALAHPPPGDALDELRIGNVNVQYHIDLLAQSRQDLIQSLCLGHGPGEAIQHPSSLYIILGQAILDDINEKSIGNELPCIHELLGLNTEGCSAANILSQYISCGDVLYMVFVDDHLGLCAFTGSRWTYQNNIHFLSS